MGLRIDEINEDAVAQALMQLAVELRFSQGLSRIPALREAYRKRRCILPVDGFFEWKAINGHKAKQPYAIAIRAGARLGSEVCGNTDPTSSEWVRDGSPAVRLRAVHRSHAGTSRPS